MERFTLMGAELKPVERKIFEVTDCDDTGEKRAFVCFADNSIQAKFKVSLYLQEHKQDDLAAEATAREILFVDMVFLVG